MNRKRYDSEIVVSVATRNDKLPAEFPILDIDEDVVFGISDVALARNVQISRALNRQRKAVLVIVDDDMVITLDQVRALANQCRVGRPVTARYCPRGKPELVTVTQYADCLTAGLGACAIHFSDLRELERMSFKLPLGNGEVFSAFTMSQPTATTWLSEDHCLWSRLCHEVGAKLELSDEVVHHRDHKGVIWTPAKDAEGARTKLRTRQLGYIAPLPLTEGE